MKMHKCHNSSCALQRRQLHCGTSLCHLLSDISNLPQLSSLLLWFISSICVCPHTQFCYFTCRSSSFPYWDTNIGKSEVQKLYSEILKLISILRTCENRILHIMNAKRASVYFILFGYQWFSFFLPGLNVGFNHVLIFFTCRLYVHILVYFCCPHYPLLLFLYCLKNVCFLFSRIFVVIKTSQPSGSYIQALVSKPAFSFLLLNKKNYESKSVRFQHLWIWIKIDIFSLKKGIFLKFAKKYERYV